MVGMFNFLGDGMKVHFDNSKVAGREDVVYGDKRYTGTDAVGKLLRDTEYDGIVYFYRDGVEVGILDAGATDKHGLRRKDYALTESDTKKLGFVKYKELEEGTYAPK